MIGKIIFRIHRYYSENGLLKTISHFFAILNRTVFQNAFILFYCDLRQLIDQPRQGHGDYDVVLIQNVNELDTRDLNKILEKRGTEAESQIRNRFSKGACLWLIKQREEFFGFVWTICKNPIRPYFFPLTENDVHVFDNEIFADYRGKGINPILINNVLVELAKKDFVRAYIETAVWNKPEIRSLGKTSFRQFAKMRKLDIFGSNITKWSSIE